MFRFERTAADFPRQYRCCRAHDGIDAAGGGCCDAPGGQGDERHGGRSDDKCPQNDLPRPHEANKALQHDALHEGNRKSQRKDGKPDRERRKPVTEFRIKRPGALHQGVCEARERENQQE